MVLELFDHRNFTHYRTADSQFTAYGHTFGGDAASFGLRFVNAEHPFHMIYRLDLKDPAIPLRLPDTDFLPLIYGFRFAAFESRFTYGLRNQKEIEILVPNQLHYDPAFPYPGHPARFPCRPVAFEPIAYDRTRAEDALSLQAIFGLDGLSEAEMDRAVRLSFSDGTYFGYSRNELVDPNWSEQEILRYLGNAPFVQGVICFIKSETFSSLVLVAVGLPHRANVG